MTQTQALTAGVVPVLTLGWRLRMSLEESGHGVAEVAELLGVTRSTVQRWTHDTVRPRRAYLAQWALLTGCDLGWLSNGQWAPWDSNPQPTDYVCDVLAGPWGGDAA